MNNLLVTEAQIYRMIRRRGPMPTSPPQSVSIPSYATGIAVYLEDKGASETAQRIGEANFSTRFSLFCSRVKMRLRHTISIE